MGKIVRLTESDLVRIVKRVINESLKGNDAILKTLDLNGKKYQVRYYPGNDSIAFADAMNPGENIKDGKLIDMLNAKAGFSRVAGIQAGTGMADRKYVLKHCANFGDDICSKLNF